MQNIITSKSIKNDIKIHIYNKYTNTIISILFILILFKCQKKVKILYPYCPIKKGFNTARNNATNKNFPTGLVISITYDITTVSSPEVSALPYPREGTLRIPGLRDTVPNALSKPHFSM